MIYMFLLEHLAGRGVALSFLKMASFVRADKTVHTVDVCSDLSNNITETESLKNWADTFA